ncbi:PIN domain-like protein, partial [Pisolithus tinctorius]
SAWMHSLINVFSWHQAGTGQSHEMDIIFCHLSTISHMFLHPYFVFDGPDCPQLKRGKDVVGLTFPRLLVQRFQELLTAFSFNWHVAPGEADVELANLQSYGLIEAVVTLYNDVLLFGVTCIIRSGTPYSTRYEDILVYSSKDIENCASLELGDLYLILLMSSVDAETGNQWCSMDVARRLAKYGFGRSLLRVATTLQFAKFMSFVSKWHDSVCELLGHRHYELACIIVEECIEFPDPAVLAMYLLPLTSWLDNGHPPVTVVMSRQPDLTSLVEFCSQHLDWPPDIIQSRLVDAHAGAAVRALIQVSYVIINTSTLPHHPPYPAARQC